MKPPRPLRRSRSSTHAVSVRGVVGIVIAALCASFTGRSTASAAELETRTARAYDAYLADAQRGFLARIEGTAPRPRPTDAIVAGPARGDGITSVPGGLIHHWVAKTHIRGVTLADVLASSAAYGSYDDIYTAVIASRLVGHEGDSYRVWTRVREGEAGITAVFEVQSTVRYARPANGRVYAFANADEIREVRNAGRPDERLLPPGRDRGYLWRANTFNYFEERPDGVYVELETLGLSRSFPSLLGWAIEPVARRLGRRSIETALREFRAALGQPRQ